MRFAYVYFMKGPGDRIGAVAPDHSAYWRELRLLQYVGGPFSDRSGGSISFEAASPSDAERIVRDDPFVVHGLIQHGWLKEWLPEDTMSEPNSPKSTTAS